MRYFVGMADTAKPGRSDPDATGAYRPEPAAPPAERFTPGALLAGRYRVVAALGKGGMGEVYRADDLTLGQPVALKFLPADLAAEPDRLARFGLLAAITMSATAVVAQYNLLTLDPSAWYFGQGLIVAGCVVVPAALACWTATGRPRLFTGGFFGDD